MRIGTLAVGALWLALAAPAGAATIPVTTTGDLVDPSDGLCSLREAVDAANNDAQASGAVQGECPAGEADPVVDTISLDTGTYKIALETPASDDDLTNAEDDLDVSTSVKFVGKGPSATTIQVDGIPARAIQIDGATPNVTIDGLKITGGQPLQNDPLGGGAVLAQNGDLTLTNCVIQDNRAADGTLGSLAIPNGSRGDWGGGVAFAGGGNLTVDGCRFEDNHAGNGGAGVSFGSGTGTGGTGGEGGYGGALYLHGGTIKIMHSTFVDNSAGAGGAGGKGGDTAGAAGNGGPGGRGGVIATNINFSGTEISDTTFEGNSAGAGGHGGTAGPGDLGRGGSGGNSGAIDLTGGVTFTRVKFLMNSAGDGGHGGEAAVGDPQNHNSVGGNGGNGGAFAGGIAGAVVVTDSTVSGNSAGNGGLGSENTGGTGGAGGSGGAFHSGNAGLTFERSTISGNSAGDGASGSNLGGAGAGGFGGGIFLTNNSATLSLLNVTAAGNSGGNGGAFHFGSFPGGVGGRGGAIFLSGTPSLTATHVTISGNRAGKTGENPTAVPPIEKAENTGGAIAASSGTGRAQLTSSILASNGAYACEGAISAGDDTIGYDPVSPSCPGRDVDPLLGALGDNGGPTQTMALGAGSPALDIAPAASCPGTDQRGITRPQGGACDAGAFEREVTAPPPDNGGGGGGGGGGNEPPPDTTPPLVKLLLLKPHIANALKKGYSTVFTSNEKGTATVELRVGRKKVGRGTKALTKTGRQKVVANFTKKARKKYKHAKKLKLTVLVTVTDAAGNDTLKKKTLTLKR